MQSHAGSFIHSKNLHGAYYIPGTVLDTGDADTMMNEAAQRSLQMVTIAMYAASKARTGVEHVTAVIKLSESSAFLQNFL